jgi:dolichol-phosphate mannosyltransferase
MRGGHHLCILLPVLNEVENIEPLLDQIESTLSADCDYVVCVVDDGSRDGTRETLERRALVDPNHLHVIERTKTRRGSQRGGALYAALVWGANETDCDVFVEMDGDLSHRPEEIPAAVEYMDSTAADVVVASKFAPGSHVINRPLGRQFVSWFCSVVVHLFISRRIRDYSNGFRFYGRKAADAILTTKVRYTSPIYLSEVLAIWLRKGLAVHEISTLYVGRGEGLSKLRLTDLLKAGVGVLEISLRYHSRGFAPAGAGTPTQSSGTGELSLRK